MRLFRPNCFALFFRHKLRLLGIFWFSCCALNLFLRQFLPVDIINSGLSWIFFFIDLWLKSCVTASLRSFEFNETSITKILRFFSLSSFTSNTNCPISRGPFHFPRTRYQFKGEKAILTREKWNSLNFECFLCHVVTLSNYLPWEGACDPNFVVCKIFWRFLNLIEDFSAEKNWKIQLLLSHHQKKQFSFSTGMTWQRRALQRCWLVSFT